MTDLGPRERIEPPEIREPEEGLRLIEFYVDLGRPHAESDLFNYILQWLEGRGPLTLVNLSFHYQPETQAGEPPMLVGLLVVGSFIDVG